MGVTYCLQVAEVRQTLETAHSVASPSEAVEKIVRASSATPSDVSPSIGLQVSSKSISVSRTMPSGGEPADTKGYGSKAISRQVVRRVDGHAR